MTVVHLVYPYGPQARAPQAIGRRVAERLLERFDVVQHDWDSVRRIRPAVGDVLLGHPHPNPWTTYRRSVGSRRWSRVIAMFPFVPDLRQDAFADGAVRRSDRYLAITGNYWFQAVRNSPFAHWLPKMVHVDLAVDLVDFPPLRTDPSPGGSRRFLYIGHSGFSKNTDYLAELAARRPRWQWSWIGSGRRPIPNLRAHGTRDLASEAGRRLVAEHDFLITVGRFDANPTTILEAMAWGLIPVCTPQSGYEGYPGIVNVPLDDADAAIAILDELQALPDDHIRQMQTMNRELLERHFNWRRFGDQMIEAVTADPINKAPWLTAPELVRFRYAAVTSPYSPIRPRNARQALGAAYRSIRIPPRRLDRMATMPLSVAIAGGRR